MKELFDYQQKAIEMLRAGFRTGKKRGLLCMLMGAGKSIVAMEMMKLCSENGKRSLFLCDRRMLADQAVEVARDQGLHAGLILSGRGHDFSAPCQFASKQTLMSWIRRGKYTLPEFDLIVVDESHRGTSGEWGALLQRWPNAFIVGLTATPCLGNGSGMGAYYDFLVQPIKPSELRERGRTVPVRAFAPHIPNLDGVKKGVDGDYDLKALASRMTRDNLIGDIAGWWKKLAEGRPSIYSACDVAHAIAIRDEFRAAGVGAEMICDETPDEEREAIKGMLKRGVIHVVCQVDCLSEGVDWPFVSCVGLVRPTKRLRRYLQIAGRGMRACEEKDDCVLIDHSGCVLLHGFPDIDRDWPLDPKDNIDKKTAAEKESGEPKTIQCANCTALFSGSRVCPECGHNHVWTKQGKDYAQGSGTLVEVSKGELPPDVEQLVRERYWATCIATAVHRGKKAGAAAAMFSDRFGVPPWKFSLEYLPPDMGDWKKPAREVWTGFAREKKVKEMV